MGDKMSDSDFKAMYIAMDADGNGEVDFAEFCSFLTLMSSAFEDAAKKYPAAPEQAPATSRANSFSDDSVDVVDEALLLEKLSSFTTARALSITDTRYRRRSSGDAMTRFAGKKLRVGGGAAAAPKFNSKLVAGWARSKFRSVMRLLSAASPLLVDLLLPRWGSAIIIIPPPLRGTVCIVLC